MPIARRNKRVVQLKDIDCPYCNAIGTVTRITEEVLEYALLDGEDLWTIHVRHKCSACGESDHST